MRWSDLAREFVRAHATAVLGRLVVIALAVAVIVVELYIIYW